MKESLKLISSFIYSFIVAFASIDPIFLFPLVIVLLLERNDFFQIVKKVFLLNFFIVILVLFVYFHNSGEALEIFIRTNLILTFNIALFYRSQGYDIVRGLDSLKFPSKIVSVFYFTLSLINYLTQDLKETKNTLRESRGFVNQTSMFTYQTYGNIFAIIVIKALRKAEDMKLSMEARGFKDKIFFLNSSDSIRSEKILLFTIGVVLIKVLYELFS